MTSNWEHTASLYQGRRAVGGRIEVGHGRLLFKPHAFDRKTGGRSLDVSLESITAIEKTERSWSPATFSPRRCLLVRTSNGTESKFLVNRLDQLVDRLKMEVAEASAS